jgi:hypothetical protein
MNANPAYVRVAAENAVRKQLLSLMLRSLASVAYQLGSSAGHAAAHREIRQLLIANQGELLAPFAPSSPGPDDFSATANEAARSVLADFLAEFDRSFGNS